MQYMGVAFPFRCMLVAARPSRNNRIENAEIVDSNCHKPIIKPARFPKEGVVLRRKVLSIPAEPGSSVLTIDELVEYRKISNSTLYKLAQEGSIPGQKVGKHWRFHKDAVDQWLRHRGPIVPTPQTPESPS